jgi:GT2 family glycosyltransferase
MRDIADVFIPMHGRSDLLAACLTALERGNSEAIGTVFVVDDASPREEALRARTVCSGRSIRTEFIALDARSGFVAAANAAWTASHAEIGVVLNNDTEPAPGAIGALCRILTSEDDVAAVGATSDNPRDLFQYRPEPAMHRTPTPAHYLTGMCLAIRRRAVGTTLFDAAYSPGYFEDLDLSCRLRVNGWRLAIAEDALVHHLGGATFSTTAAWSSPFERNYARFTAQWGWLPSHAALDDALQSASGSPSVGR